MCGILINIMTIAYKVGKRGQVVIGSKIRAELGIAPGWMAIQRLVDDHVEIRFLPPEHSRSLKGKLASYAKASLDHDELRRAREEAWSSEVVQRFGEVTYSE